MTLTSLIQKNKIFMSLFFIWLIACSALLLVINKGDETLFCELNRNKFLDIFFSFWTNTGEGLFFVAFTIILSMYKFRYAILSIIIFSASGLFGQFLKKIIYGPVPRPSKFFENIQKIKGVDGVEMHSVFSFPSGHTITAFALFTFIAIISPNKYGFFWLIFAVLTAFSRIYLCQHFLIDTFAGSAIGTIFCITFWIWASNWKWLQNEKLNRGFLTKK